MPFANNKTMQITLALRRENLALAAIDALAGNDETAVIEGLVELLYDPPSARAAIATIRVLQQRRHPLVEEGLLFCLQSTHTNVRVAALYALRESRSERATALATELLRTDASWRVRRAALRLLVEHEDSQWTACLYAFDDPHWRVRYALIHCLLEWDPDRVWEYVDRYFQHDWTEDRAAGIVAYLHYRWRGETDVPTLRSYHPVSAYSFWDWDTAVLARNLERLDESALCEALPGLPYLLSYDNDRVRGLAVDHLRSFAEAEHLALAVGQLQEPRTGCVEWVDRLMRSVDEDRREATARLILHTSDANPAQLSWAIRQIDEVFPLEEELDLVVALLRRWSGLPRSVRAELVRLIPRVEDSPISVDVARRGTLERASEPLGDETHPHVRAAALTETRANALMANPEEETSWHVLETAARMTRTPLWKIEPEVWTPPTPPRPLEMPLTPSCQLSPHSVALGKSQIVVSRMGVSGHYGLPVEGFVRALESGVNLMFWEPNYSSMTEFVNRLGPTVRREVYLICGTFEADGKRIRRDAERALRLLGIERIDLFLLFWVQDWKRIPRDVSDTLTQLQHEGKIDEYSMSTHNRELALEVIERGWNPVMVRHSAAHLGAEAQIFPTAVERGTTLITFNNTCYGRLLERHRDLPRLRPSDCYRYTLAQPGVSVCLTAPATLEQLAENLEALHEPTLSPESRELLLAHGGMVYEEDTIFRKCVRAL